MSVSVRVSVCLCSVDRDYGQRSVINSKKSSRATVVFSGVFFSLNRVVRLIRNQPSGKADCTNTGLGWQLGRSRQGHQGCAPPSHHQADPYAERPGLQGPPPCTPLRGCCWESPLWPQAAGPLPAVCAQGPGPSARQPSWLSALGSSPPGNAERGVGGHTWWCVLGAWEPGAASGCRSPSFRIQAGCEVGTHALPGAGRARQPLS